MIDNSEYWKDYPKRGKSFICYISNDRDEPNWYQYIVIPENGSKWAIAPEDDIYSCFESTIGHPDEFFNMMNQMSLNLKLGGISDNSFDEMKEDINKLQKTLHERWKNFLDFEDYYGNYLGYNTKDLFSNFLWKFWEKDMVNQIEILMEPKKNYFDLYDYKNIKYQPFLSETWTDSPCVFVKYNAHFDIMSKISQKIGKKLYLKYFESIWTERKYRTKKRFIKASQKMTVEEAVDFVINNCEEYLEHPVKIIRGLRTNDATNIFYSKPVKRWSRDNYNYYNLIMDNHPSWAQYPKRNKSFICSLNKLQMSNIEYFVIPEDGSTWGVAPKSDILQSFNEGIKKYITDGYDIDMFFNDLSYIYCDIHQQELNDTNYRIFKNQLLNFDLKKLKDEYEKIKKSEFKYFKFKRLEYFFNKSNDNVFKKIIDIINPKINNFKLLSYKELYNDMENLSINECWTDSPCLFIEKK